MTGAGNSGAFTLMLTDVEGSTRLWELDPAAMAQAMARHDAMIADVVAAHGGQVVRARGEGDSSFSTFATAAGAVAAAVELQLAMHREPWPRATPLKVRLAIHTGDTHVRDGDLYGTPVNRCARLRSMAAGGQALVSAAVKAAVTGSLPPQVSLRDLGKHRLKDLAEPERIYQLSHPALPSEFPDLRGLEVVPNNLPVQLTSFIGREDEIPELAERVGRVRLLTLTGAGGCGKTRLALEVAASVSDSFDGGVWFADLSGITDPALLPATVAAAIGLKVRVGGESAATLPTTVDSMVRHLQGRRTLLVVDNCEHLVRPCGDLINSLLRGTRGLALVATSREILGVPGEVNWRVASMAVPDPRHMPEFEVLASYDSVRLFADRARRSDPSFRLNDENAASVGRICVQVDGIPLAIELAAARVTMLEVDQIAERLERQFRLLSSPSGSARGRQATLTETIDWSYALLEPAEARMFRRLAVFAGGWTLEAAEAICAAEPGDDGLELLSRLVDKSLVQRERDVGGGRFRLLEPLRRYAEEKLGESADIDDLRERHLGWYLRRAEMAGRALTGERQLQTLEALDADLDNLRSALEWAISRRRPEALPMAASLRLYWLYRGLMSEGRDWLGEALDASDGATAAARIEALMGLGRLELELGEQEAAATHHAQARELAEAEGDAVAVTQATRYLAQEAFARGGFDEAIALFTEAITRARDAGDGHILALTLLDAATASHESGEGDAHLTEAMMAEGLDLCRAFGDDRNVALGLRVLSQIQAGAGLDEAALASGQASVALSRRVGDRSTLVKGLAWLGTMLSMAEQPGPALDAIAEGVEMAVELGYSQGIVDGLEAAAGVLSMVGDARQGARLLGRAEALRAEIQSPMSPAGRARIADTRRAIASRLDAEEFSRARREGAALSLRLSSDLLKEFRRQFAKPPPDRDPRSARGPR